MTEPRKTVIDPMGGTGDLLDATIERSLHHGLRLERVHAVELDEDTAITCRERLAAWQNLSPSVDQTVTAGSAFNRKIQSQLEIGSYDLVITNPPYVRYQSISSNGTGDARLETPEDMRKSLLAVVERMPWTSERHVWQTLVKAYSGYSDLSVPAWLLAAMLVKPTGVLALVAPATWRTRDYADVLQYMLARFFRLEAVVADRQPGWFSQALVRTHLVVASRLPPEDTGIPLAERCQGRESFPWVEITPEAQGGDSLVGSAFSSDDPDGEFAQWLQSLGESVAGIYRNERSLESEVAEVVSRCGHSKWFAKLEPVRADAPLYGGIMPRGSSVVPHALSDNIDIAHDPLTTLEHLGIRAGQGLRTGCNDFFYVDFIGTICDGWARVKLSSLFMQACIDVPVDALVPVLRRQAELKAFAAGHPLPSRLLYLCNYVLPEDISRVEDARLMYERLGQLVPTVMPEPLAAHVRIAAETRTSGGNRTRIPDLSAVKTNERMAVQGRSPKLPRFWYMLPNLVRRHTPDTFVPRINQRSPMAVANRTAPVVVDANFSTLWSVNSGWTPSAISALLQSSWARACMEAIGTPMGGGALKLEATHLRRLPLPSLKAQEIGQLASLGDGEPITAADLIVTKAVLGGRANMSEISRVNECLIAFIADAEQARQRG